MRIAMISTPFLPVPPPRYGGTELVVWELVEGLHEAGHDVTLFTAGPAGVSVRVRRRAATCTWPPEPYAEIDHASWAVGEIIADGGFDVVHTHVAGSLPLARFVDAPFIYTVHHERDDGLARLYAAQERVRIVAISARQGELLPELMRPPAVVWHGLSPSRYPLGPGGGAAVFLGRFAREKGVHVAIDAAARAGHPIILAGQPHWKDEDYFRMEVAPRLHADGRDVRPDVRRDVSRDARHDVRWIGEVGHDEKVALLGQAPALLFPIAWEEPFGLVLVEAMLAGTPVLAFGRGSVPEVIEPGVTGWVCGSVDEMAQRLRALCDGSLDFDRAKCRARAAERFGRRRMVADYLALYEEVLGRRVPSSSSETVNVGTVGLAI